MDGSSVIPVPVIGAQRDIRWADVGYKRVDVELILTRTPKGLRGIAALFVVTSHISRAFAPTLLDPQRGYDARPTLFHLPFLRLPAQGPPWVALFFVLTGYVNAMRPIKQARSGNTTAAFENLASSSLRRTARLVLPTTVATVASWFVCQLGGYRLAKACEADWIRYSSPEPSSGAIAAVTSLLRNIFTTWASGSNQYDPVQWTLTFLLKASMLIYMVLLATVRTTSFYRMLVFLGMYAFSWASGDCKTLHLIQEGFASNLLTLNSFGRPEHLHRCFPRRVHFAISRRRVCQKSLAFENGDTLGSCHVRPLPLWLPRNSRRVVRLVESAIKGRNSHFSQWL